MKALRFLRRREACAGTFLVYGGQSGRSRSAGDNSILAIFKNLCIVEVFKRLGLAHMIAIEGPRIRSTPRNVIFMT